MSVIHKTNRFAYKYLSILILSSQFLLATFVFWTFQQEPANAAVTITCPTSNSGTIYSEIKTNLGLGSSAVSVGSETSVQVSIALVDSSDNPIETSGRLSLTYVTGLTFTESGGTYNSGTQTYSYGVNHVHNFYGTPTNVNRALDTLAYISDSNDTSATLLCRAFPRNDAYEYYSNNDHFYRWIDRGNDNDGVSNSIDTFTEMAEEACSDRYLGMQGYLVTIESAAENTFITEIAGEEGTAPIGATDVNITIDCDDGDSNTTEQDINLTIAEGDWTWIDGPSKGCQFWDGLGTSKTPAGNAVDCDINDSDSAVQYSNWNGGGEPNQAGGNEDYGQFLINAGNSANGKWNDIPNAGSLGSNQYYWDGYIIEYGGRSGETSGISSDSMSITVTAQSTITITCPATQSAFPQTATDLLGSSAVTGGSSSTVVLVTVGLSDNSSSTDGLSNLISTTGSLTMSTTTGLTFTQSGGSYNASTDSYTYGTYHVHTFYGTRANVNAALDTLSYTSDATDNVAYLDCRASQKFDDIEYFAETNHFYQQFDSVSYLRWDQTLRDSCTTRYRGLQGYLMDYTSSAEREWVEDIFDSDGTVWMGGSDDDITHTHTCSDDQTGTTEDNISVTISAEGDWTWVDGPNKGTQFWDGGTGGSAQNSMYNAWGSSQPSNSDSSQHWLTAVLNESYEGKWNDADVETSTDYESSLTQEKFYVDSYIVEFGGRSSTYDTTTNTLSSDETKISVAPPAVTITCPSTLAVDREVETSVGLSNPVSSTNIGSFNVQVTVALTNGTNGDGLDTVISTTGDLTMSTTTGLTFTESGGTYISASDTYNYGANHVHTFYGTLSNVNAALNTLKYDSDSDDTAADLDCRAFARVSGYEYFGGTNHFYKAIAMNTNTNWEDAILPLCDLRYKGLQGYALSIESQAENDWIKDTFGNQGTVFLGGTDSNETFTYDCDDNDSSTTEDDISVTIAAEGDWTWIDGPNKGTQFWDGGKDGSVQNSLFENWGVKTETNRQPDNSSNEDFLQIWLDDIPSGWSQGDWNDMERNPYGNTNSWEVVDSVIVEFGGRSATYDASDPIAADHTDITIYQPAQITCPSNTTILGFKTFTSIDDDTANNYTEYDVFFSVTKGTLTIADTSNATFTTGDGTDDATMEFTISRSNFDTAMASLIYKPTLDSNYTDGSTDTLTCKIRNSNQSDWSDTDTATLTRELNQNDAGNNLCTNINDKETFAQTSILLGEYFTFEEDSNDITVLKAPNGQLTMRNTSVSSFAQGDGTGDAYSSSYTQGNLTGFNTAFDSGSNSSGADFYVSFLVYTPDSGFPSGSSATEYFEVFSFETSTANDPIGYCMFKIDVYSNPTVEWDDSDDSIAIAENASATSLGGATITYSGSNNLDVSVSSDNGTLSFSSCSLTDSDSTNGRVVLNGSLSALNTCLGNLQFAPSTDFEGTASLSISATPDTDFQYFSQTNHYYYQYQGSEAPYRSNMTRIFTNMKFATLDGYVLTLECQSEEDFILNTDNFSFDFGGSARSVDAFLAVNYNSTDSEWQYSDGPQNGNLVGYDDCSDSSWTEPTDTSDSKYTTVWATGEPTSSAGTLAFINGYTGDDSTDYGCATEYEPTTVGWGDTINGAPNCNVFRASDNQTDSATYNQGMIGEFGGDGGTLPSSLTDSLSVVVSSSLSMSSTSFGNINLTRGSNNDVTATITISGTSTSLTLKIQSDTNGSGKLYIDTDDSNSYTTGEQQLTNSSRVRIRATSNCPNVYDDQGVETPGNGNYPSDWLTLDGTLQTIATCTGPFTSEELTIGFRIIPVANEIQGTYEIQVTYTVADS
jgi:hypothetical protein